MEVNDELIRNIKNGELQGYSIIIEKYQQRIHKYSFHMLGHLQEAEDLTQDVFVKGLEKINQYQAGTPILAWLYKIAYHLCLNKIKRNQMYG